MASSVPGAKLRGVTVGRIAATDPADLTVAARQRKPSRVFGVYRGTLFSSTRLSITLGSDSATATATAPPRLCPTNTTLTSESLSISRMTSWTRSSKFFSWPQVPHVPRVLIAIQGQRCNPFIASSRRVVGPQIMAASQPSPGRSSVAHRSSPRPSLYTRSETPFLRARDSPLKCTLVFQNSGKERR